MNLIEIIKQLFCYRRHKKMWSGAKAAKKLQIINSLKTKAGSWSHEIKDISSYSLTLLKAF